MAGTSFKTGIGNNTVHVDTIVSGVGVNYIGTESGASNALVAALTDIAGNNISLAAGLRVLLKTSNTLQAGANTLNLASSGVKDIKSVSGRNLKTAYAVGAIIDLVYDGTNWQLLNATY